MRGAGEDDAVSHDVIGDECKQGTIERRAEDGVRHADALGCWQPLHD